MRAERVALINYSRSPPPLPPPASVSGGGGNGGRERVAGEGRGESRAAAAAECEGKERRNLSERLRDCQSFYSLKNVSEKENTLEKSSLDLQNIFLFIIYY
jgi:hypothetical protein